MMHPFAQFLKQRLDSSDLPGRTSQLKMAPEPISEQAEHREMNAPDDTKNSSVLILLFPNDEGVLELVLTLRTPHINHGGQLSFPGGRAERGESPTQTALREAREEIGITPNDVKIVGKLSRLYVSHSDNHVSPIIGFLDYTPEITINPKEVEEAFSVELDSLLNKKNLTIENWDLRNDSTYKVPYWDVHRVPLWGATAMMLNEFLELYREFKKTSD